MTPHEVRDAIQEIGFRAKIEDEEEICTTIASSAEGVPFLIFLFRDYPEDGDLSYFDNVTFMNAFSIGDDFSLAQINQWNAIHRFGKLYIDKDGASLEMETFTPSETLSEDHFRSIFYTWTTLLSSLTEIEADQD